MKPQCANRCQMVGAVKDCNNADSLFICLVSFLVFLRRNIVHFGTMPLAKASGGNGRVVVELFKEIVLAVGTAKVGNKSKTETPYKIEVQSGTVSF